MKLTANQKEVLADIAEKFDKLAERQEEVNQKLLDGSVSEKVAAEELEKVNSAAMKIAQYLELNPEYDVDFDEEDIDEEEDFDFDDDEDIELNPIPEDEDIFDNDIYDDIDTSYSMYASEEKKASIKKLSSSEKSFLLKVADKLEILADRKDEITAALKENRISEKRANEENSKVNKIINNIAEDLSSKGLDLDI